MKKSVVAFLAASTAFAAMPALAQTTYVGSHSVGTTLIDISITTDGTIGALAAWNLLNWSFTLTDGANVVSMTPGTAALTYLSGSAFQATASQILFDFGGNGHVQWDDFQGAFTGAYCMTAATSSATCSGGQSEEVAYVEGTVPVIPRSGTLVLGEVQASGAVPEPAAWAMMVGGFGLVGGAMRRRRADTVRVRFA